MAGLKSLWRNEQGSAIVMVCAALVVLIGMTALVVDVGRFYMVNYRLSNAADAAALAGIHELAESASSAENMALTYAQKNGFDAENVKAKASPADGTVTVQVEQEVSYIFGRLLVEEEDLKMEQSSTAATGSLNAIKGAAPLGIKNHNFSFGEEYILKVGANSDYGTGLGSGNFGTLALGGGGSSRYEENLEEGYEGKLETGDIVNTETGNMSNPTKRAIDERINNSVSSCYTEKIKGCSRILFIPVFEPEEESQNQVKSIKIIGFAAFWVKEVKGQGNESQIRGYFIEMITSGEIGSQASNFGLEGIKLID